MSVTRRAGRAVLTMLLVVSLATAAHMVNALVRPLSGPERVTAQVRWLNGAIDRGAPGEMQALFPEGAFFTYALTGLAAARTGDRATVDRAVREIDDAGVKAGFGTIPELEHGTFYRGWRLLILTEQSRLSGQGTDGLLAEARTVLAALVADPDGVPPSYPGQRWPCDAVVAMAAVIEAHRVAGTTVPAADLASWRTAIDRHRDPSTGLLVHQLAGAGTQPAVPRGSSQAVIQTFWPVIDPAGAPEQWRRYVDAFVVREAGLVGVREYPRGLAGSPDVDSGPLVLGVSLSASAVTLGAARANGDLTLAIDLDREAELLGFPLEWGGERRFAFGIMPVGDAFVAWARGVPLGAQSAAAAPRPLWALWLALPLLTCLAATAGLVRTRHSGTGRATGATSAA